MPPTETPLEPAPEPPLPASTEEQRPPRALEVDPNAPLSFVPHEAPGDPSREPVRIRTNRYGEMEEHELVRLLDTIEDERARGRFRESIYMSAFIWLAIAWFIFYGPRVLWHAPRLINPADILKQRELTHLDMPVLPNVATPRSAPAPRPTLDRHTLDALRKMEREEPRPTPAPPPAPAAHEPVVPNVAPSVPPPIAPRPTPKAPPPVVAEAPTPQPTTKPNFNANTGSAGDAIRQAEKGVASNRSGGSGFASSPESPGEQAGVQVLSDMQGVDFTDYLRRIEADVYRNWLPLLPEETKPPLMKTGETYIRFTILPNGTIGAMHLDGSTHDDAINRSCWGSITSEGQFPPLPKAFHGPNLELRFLYMVNERPPQ